MQQLIDIIQSLVGGVAAGAIGSLIGLNWRKIFLPWFENLLYKDARIDGEWRSTTTAANGTEPRESVLRIKQYGHKITGRVININGPTRGKTYMFSGEIRNLILTGTYTATDPSEIDRGTVTLHLLANGTRLCGHMAYYSNTKNSILTAEYEAERSYASEGKNLQAPSFRVMAEPSRS